MNVSEAGEKLIKAFEGLGDGDPHTAAIEPYFDSAGKATVGRGHLLLDAEGRVIQAASKTDAVAIDAAKSAMVFRYGKFALSVPECDALLNEDIKDRFPKLTYLIGDTPVWQRQIDALFSIGFNIGFTALSHSTLFARFKGGATVGRDLNFKDLESNSQHGIMPAGLAPAFGAWSHAGGRWTLGLFRRRMAEVMVYRGDDVDDAIRTAMAII